MGASLQIKGSNGVDYRAVSQVVFQKGEDLWGLRFGESLIEKDFGDFIQKGIFPDQPLSCTVVAGTISTDVVEPKAVETFIADAVIVKLVLVVPARQLKDFTGEVLDPWHLDVPDGAMDERIREGYSFTGIPYPDYLTFKFETSKLTINVPIASDLSITYLPCDVNGDGVF